MFERNTPKDRPCACERDAMRGHEARDHELWFNEIHCGANVVAPVTFEPVKLSLNRRDGLCRCKAVMKDSGPQVVGVAGHPGSSDRAAVRWHEAVALKISKLTPDSDTQFVGEIAEAPSLTTRDASRHEGVTPVETRAGRHVHIETQCGARAGKRNDRVPMTVQLGVIFKNVPVIDGSRRGRDARAHLQRRLRRQDGLCAGSKVNRLAERIAWEDTRTGADDDHVRRIVDLERATDAKRRLGVLAGENRSVMPPLEPQLEARGPPDSRSLAAIQSIVRNAGPRDDRRPEPRFDYAAS